MFILKTVSAEKSNWRKDRTKKTRERPRTMLLDYLMDKNDKCRYKQVKVMATEPVQEQSTW